jgi:O-antigen ligase
VERFSLTGSSNLSRFAIWIPALRVIRAHPLAGIGLDQFLYQPDSYGIPNTRFQTVSHPHNWILDTCLRLGIWGLLLMIATMVVYMVAAIRAYAGRKGTVLGAIILALIAGMTDHIVHGLVDMAYFSQDLALTFWMLLGLLGAVLLLGPARPVEAAAPVAAPAEAA